MKEKSYVMLKPGYEKFLKPICERIENIGGNISNVQPMMLSKEVVREHYAHISQLEIFEDIVNYMSGGLVVGMIVEGEDIILKIRKILGATRNPEKGTIRGDFIFADAKSFHNVIHASDSEKAANEEISRFYCNAKANNIKHVKNSNNDIGVSK